jgi:hypothetical protein
MSHFNLWVCGNNVENQLEPFAEDGPNTYTTTPLETIALNSGIVTLEDFYALIRENRKERGPILIIDKEEFENFNADSEELLTPFGRWGGKTILLCNSEGKFEGVSKTVYNGKWDYWVIGGRWAGCFMIKPNTPIPAEAIVGGSKSFKMPGDSVPPVDTYDALPKGCIDFERLETEYLETEFSKKHLKAWEVMQRFPDFKTWGNFVEKNPIENRNRYQEQPAFIALKEVGIDIYWGFDPEEYLIPNYENFLSVLKGFAWQPYAFLREGVWTERGQMLAFGITVNGVEKVNWDQTCRALLNEMPDSEYITVVDCHV